MDESRNAPQTAEAMDAGLLIRGIRRGDRESFLAVVRLFQKKVFQMAYGFFGNREDALDIVQETFLRVHEKAGLFQEGYNLQGWILQVAKNICIDYYRKNYKKRKELESDKSLDELNPAAPADRRSGEASDLQRLVGRCVNRLARRQRLIFVMRHYQEFRNEDIARILNISTGTVKSLHFKAIQNLKTMLAPYLEAQP
jgi:RNA polymerase sigma-70 factor (ECF subfamily)